MAKSWDFTILVFLGEFLCCSYCHHCYQSSNELPARHCSRSLEGTKEGDIILVGDDMPTWWWSQLSGMPSGRWWWERELLDLLNSDNVGRWSISPGILLTLDMEISLENWLEKRLGALSLVSQGPKPLIIPKAGEWRPEWESPFRVRQWPCVYRCAHVWQPVGSYILVFVLGIWKYMPDG